MATGSIYRTELAFDIYCEALGDDDMPDPNDGELQAAISFREWLELTEENRRLHRELREHQAATGKTLEWLRLEAESARFRATLEEIRDTVCVEHGGERAMLARFQELARRALEPPT